MAIATSLSEVGAELHMNLWAVSHLPEEKALRLADWVNTSGISVYVVSISPDVGWLAYSLLAQGIATLSIAHNDVGAFYAPVAHYKPLIDCAIGVSLETTRRLREGGMPAERVRNIPYGVHTLPRAEAERRIDAKQSQLRIGYIGRLVEHQKRVMDFVAVVRELKASQVQFELHIVGEGSERTQLEQELRKHGLAENVTLWGWLSPPQVKQRLAELDVFTLLSDHEGLPVALLEAMGQALVPVVTRINSGNSELIRDGENGLLFPVGDAVACASHLARLAADADMLRTLRLSAWETSREYSVERMVDNYEDCFRHVAATDFGNAHRATAPRPYPLLPACKSRYPFWLRKVKSRLATLRSSAPPFTSQAGR